MHFLPRNTRDILRFKILMNIAWIAYQFTAPLFSGPLSRRTSSFLDDIACFFMCPHLVVVVRWGIK